MKIAKIVESGADDWAVLSTRLSGVVGEAFLDLDQVALTVYGVAEEGSFGRSQTPACGPQLLRTGTGWALRARLGVGLALGGGEVVEGPVTGAAALSGVLVGPSFQRAYACFDGTIIPWHAVRREQSYHAGLVQKLERGVGAEGRTVIRFQDQRGAMGREEVSE